MRHPFGFLPSFGQSAVIASALMLALASTAASAVEFGTASVLSGKGQRLKVAIPFNAQTGQLLSVTQFQVVTSEASAGAAAPDPKRFTLSMPMNSNVLILQSEELMYADQVAIELGLASNTENNVRYEFRLP
ncbi:MAG: hypothetical protein AB8C46_21955 [Burkholderiaceae bacterium]